jgi:cytochrome c-type biogenesis protein CcmE
MTETQRATPEAKSDAADPNAQTDPALIVPARRARTRVEEEGLSRGARIGIVVGLAAMAAGIVGLVLVGIGDGAVYSKPVDELLANKSRFSGRDVRAEGNLVHGTLEKRESPCEYRFTIAKNGTELPVRYASCVVPDTFRDVPYTDVGVTVEGQLQADNTFEAKSVLAKCPSKYEMKDRQRNGEQMPGASTLSKLQ